MPLPVEAITGERRVPMNRLNAAMPIQHMKLPVAPDGTATLDTSL